MASPIFVAEYESAWNTSTSPKTVSVTTAVGDVLVVIAGTQDFFRTVDTPTGGTGLSWTLRQSVNVSGYGFTAAWTAKATAAETFTLSMTAPGTATYKWGFNCLRFADASGIGASVKINTTGAPSLGITTTQDDSAIVVVNNDWDAIDGSSRSWRTGAGAFIEKTYELISGTYTIYGGYHAAAGAVGLKTVGLSAPAAQKYALIAVEITGGVARALAGTASTAAGSTGSPSIERALSAAAATSATAAGSLSVARPVAAVAGVAGQAAGQLAATRAVTGASSAVVSARSGLSLARALGGVSAAAVGGTGSLTVTPPWPPRVGSVTLTYLATASSVTLT